VLGNDDTLILIRALVNPCVRTELPSPYAKPFIVRRFVHCVHTFKGSSPVLWDEIATRLSVELDKLRGFIECRRRRFQYKFVITPRLPLR